MSSITVLEAALWVKSSQQKTEKGETLGLKKFLHEYQSKGWPGLGFIETK